MIGAYSRGPFIGRTALIEQLVQTIGGRAGRGAILVGPAGVGKSCLAQTALGQVGEHACVIRVHGSSAVSELRYGALRSLLPGAGADVFTQPILFLRALTKQLQGRANGKPVVLFVDNAQQLDDQGAMALRQLAVAGTVTLLVVCEDLPEVPGELMSLWKDGLLTRIDVGPFDLPETVQWLCAQLGGRVSRAVGQALWDASSGNPLLLTMLLQAQLEAKTIVEEQGVWVLTGNGVVHNARVVDAVMATLGRTSPAERRVLETVALAQVLPLELLMRSTDRRAIDSLQIKGRIDIELAAPPVVRVKGHLVAEVIRGQIPPGRRRELRAAIMDVLECAPAPAVGTLALASCDLDCAVELDPQTLLTAARLANRLCEPQTALRFLGSIKADLPLGALTEKAGALVALGERRAAIAVLEQVKGTEAATALDRVQLNILHSSLLRSSSTSWREAAGALEPVVNAPGETEAESLQQLGVLELAAYQGRYSGLIDGLFELFTRGATPDIRLRAGALLCESWAMGGQQVKAERLASEITAQLERPEVLPQTRREVQTRLFTVFLTTAAWAKCDKILAAGSHPRGVLDAYRATANELAEGVLHAYRGNAERSLEFLRPAMSQLRKSDPDGALLLAAAATAYSYARLGEKNLSLDCLNEFKRCTGRSSWQLRSTARYFATLASAELASKDLAIERLLGQADAARERGALSQELRLLSGAVRLGAAEWAPRLATAATESGGPFAELCMLYASGLKNANSEQLLRALQAATALNDAGFAEDIARSAVVAAKEHGDRQALHTARQFLHDCARRLGGADLLAGDLQILTARELEVAADVVSGGSNRSIAAKMNVSVRTVEGHLYKIYGKLNITSRAELREVLTR